MIANYDKTYQGAPRRAHDGNAVQEAASRKAPGDSAMGDVIILRSIPIDLNSNTGHQFVADCTRAAEGLISDKELQEKYELSPADWQNITKDVALGHAIRAERERRVRTGTAALGPSVEVTIRLQRDSVEQSRQKPRTSRRQRAFHVACLVGVASRIAKRVWSGRAGRPIGRPLLVPRSAGARAMPARTRSWIIERSNSAIR